jgi:hypothetical protein
MEALGFHLKKEGENHENKTNRLGKESSENAKGIAGKNQTHSRKGGICYGPSTITERTQPKNLKTLSIKCGHSVTKG